MKNIPTILILIISVFLSSCQDESLDPRPNLIGGQFVRLDITKKRFNADNYENTPFEGLLTTPSNNVVKYNLYVRYRDNNGRLTDYKLLRTITNFPLTLTITRSEIATALSLPVSTFGYGANFQFYGESFDANNNKADYFSLSSTVQSANSMKQGYRFLTDISDNINFGSSDFTNYGPQ